MRIVDFFEGKNVFLTGGSGFLGKVLIEKLLRSCPKIGNVYMLLREKKGKSLDSRMEIIKGLPLFDKLREENPYALKKLIAVRGDVCDLNLGLSDQDRKMLIEKVNIIYHTAASVRFDDFLKEALLINVRGTREVCKLALELTNISLFVHVSTTYCNTDKKIIEEKLYPAHTDWRDAITLAEKCDEKTLNTMTLKYLSPLPNTYTFAKSLAEHVVEDLCKGQIPAIIVRPSVVISTRDDPISGWNDNFNGPVGLLVAGGKGVLRTVLGNRDTAPDYMPVDYVIKGLIIATNHYGVKRNINEIEVLNAAQHDIHTVTMGEVVDMGADLIKDSPFNTILWNPRFSMTKCWYNYYIQVLLFHMLPALVIDIVLRLAGKKPMLFTMQRKIYIANNVLFYFMNNSWEFLNYKYVGLIDTLQDDDEKKMFNVKIAGWTNEDIFDYFKNGKMGAAKYILKEEFDKEKGITHLTRNINEIEVLNAAQHNIHSVTMGEMIDMGAELIKNSPFNTILWNPRFSMTKCWYSYYIQVLLFHMLPAFIIDIGLRLAGRKPMLFTIQRKIYIANNVLFYFMNNSWDFLNDKYMGLLDTLQDDDEKKMFDVKIIGLTNEDIFEYYQNGKIGAAKYILKEKIDKEKGLRQLTRFWYLDMAVRTIFFSFLFWYFTFKLDVFHVLLRSVQNYIRNLK